MAFSFLALPIQADESAKEELQQLLVELNKTLQEAPPEKEGEAAEVSEATKLLVSAATEESEIILPQRVAIIGSNNGCVTW